MSDNQSKGKDIQANASGLASDSPVEVRTKIEPTLEDFSRVGEGWKNFRVYISEDEDVFINDYRRRGFDTNSPTFQQELMEEYLRIGRNYTSVNYPSSKAQEGDSDFEATGKPEDAQAKSGAANRSIEDYPWESDIIYDPNLDPNYDPDNPRDYGDDFRGFDTGDIQEIDSNISHQGVSIDHDLSEGIKQKTFEREGKDYQPYIGRGLDGDLPRDEQPREKALRLGIEALSDAELLALIFGTGVKGQNVLEMSRKILSDNMNHLSLLARLSPQELTMRYKGIGQAKAIMLCAAMALGIRAERDAHRNQMIQIDSSLKAYNLMRQKLQWLEHEEFWVIYLTKSNNLKNCCCISRGGISETVVDVRIVIQRALQESASALILVHNHPGSLLTPSEEDDQLTTKIMDAARFFDIQVLDHIIVGSSGYYSFKEHNHHGF